jgi:hypothetical protein
VKRFLCLAPIALLSACTFTTDGLNSLGSIAPSPASITHLGNTLIDDKAVAVAYVALDATTTLVDGAVAAGKLVPRSATALRVANALDAARHAINAASDAQRAGQADNYATAITQATAALSEARAAIQGAGR